MRPGRRVFVILVTVASAAVAILLLAGASRSSQGQGSAGAAVRRRAGREGRPGYFRRLRDRAELAEAAHRACPATRSGRGAPGRACSPRARTACSSSSAASCRTCTRPMTIKLPQLGPNIEFPNFRLPWRDATVASPPGALERDGKVGDDSDVGKNGVDFRWEHCIIVVDANGNIIEDWTQWDKMLRRPHAVYISPYDPEKRVWIVDDYRHAIFMFSNDGKQLLQTIGEPNVHAADDKHFYRPTFMAWLPDGTFFVADGYANTRVVKFDKNGKYLMTWGQTGATGRGAPPENAARLLEQRARHRGRSDDAAGVRERPAEPPHAGVRRERQVPPRVELRSAAVGHPPVHHHGRPVSLGGRSRHVEDAEVRPGRQLPVLVGHVGRLPRRHVGRARAEHRSGRQLLRRRSRQRARAEVSAAARREPGLAALASPCTPRGSERGSLSSTSFSSVRA